MRISNRQGCCLALWMGLLTPDAWAQRAEPKLTIVKIALEGEVAPGVGDVKFTRLQVPIINASGVVVFQETSLTIGERGLPGIFTSSGNVTSLLALGGDGPVGTLISLPVRPRFPTLSPPPIDVRINSRGVVVFPAGFAADLDATDPNFFSSSGIWKATSRTDLSLVLDCPMALGFDLLLGCRPDLKIDDAGNVVFVGPASDLTGAVEGTRALYRLTGTTSVQTIAEGGDVVFVLPGSVSFFTYDVSGGDDVLDFVLSSKGKVAFRSRLEGASVADGNDRAIFKDENGAISLVMREGDLTGLGIGTFGEPDPPSINGAGTIAFRECTLLPRGDIVSCRIWTGSGADDLERVVRTDDPIVAGSPNFSGLEPPVINKKGDIVFVAVGFVSDGVPKRGIWKARRIEGVTILDRIVQEGDKAPGTGEFFGAGPEFLFRDFTKVVVNDKGHVAFVGRLDLSSSGVTTKNDEGIWAQDPNGNLTLIAREGTVVKHTAGTFGPIDHFVGSEFSRLGFAGPSGNSDGRPSGFSDNGDVAFLAQAVVPQGSSETNGPVGIFRATFRGLQQNPGEQFVWSGACDLKEWRNTCGTTNWNDANGNPKPIPPGDKGDEIVTIANATVIQVSKAVSIGSLTATGSLRVLENLTLANDSSIEGLFLGNATLTSKGKLTLRKTNTWTGGTFDSSTAGSVVNLGTLAIEPGGTEPDGTPLIRKIAGTKPFENQGTVTQTDDLVLSTNAEIDNKASATWNLVKGNITEENRDEGGFINRGTLVKPENTNTADSTIATFFEAQNGSRLEVKKGKLTLSRGAPTLGNSTIFVSNNQSASLIFSAAVGSSGGGVYNVTQGKKVSVTTDGPSTPFITKGAVRLTDTAVLDLQGEMALQKNAVLVFDGGTIKGDGVLSVATDARIDWNAGTIGVPGEGAKSANVKLKGGGLFIKGGSERTLAGTLTVDGKDSSVFQDGVKLTINAGKVELKKGVWALRGNSTVAAGAGGGLDIATFGVLDAFASGDITFSAPLDNRGDVKVRGGRLRLTGAISQVSGNTLTAGTWKAETTTVNQSAALDMPNRTITTIGSGASVQLNFGGTIPPLKLRTINGLFRLFGATYKTPADLTNKLELFIVRGGKLTVSGTLVNDNTLAIGANSSVEAVDFFTGANSSTTIKRTGSLTAQLWNVRGTFKGNGTMNGQQFDNRGRLRPGSSPGVMTLNGDYTQFPEGSLEIDIGGMTPGMEHDQLVINGNVQLDGTLIWKAVDDFAPQTGESFEFLSVSGTQTGDFANVEIVDLAPGFEFEVTPTDEGMMMTAMTDGVFTGIVGEINAVHLGPAPPDTETTASPGDVNVPVLQFEVVPEADGLSINRLSLKAAGTGDDKGDLTAVTVWVDENGDGRVDQEPPTVALAVNGVDADGDALIAESDREIGSGTYDADNGTLNLSIDPPLELLPRESATLLVTYNITGANTDAQAMNDRESSLKPPLSLGFAAIALTLFLCVGLITNGKARASALLCLCFGTTVWIIGCASVDVTGPAVTTATYRVTLTAIGANETGTGVDASVENLSVTGTNLTVVR